MKSKYPEDIVVICNTPHILDWTVLAMKANGFVLHRSYIRKKYIFFGPKQGVYIFAYFPSDELIQKFINDCIAAEQYESARSWQNVLDHRKNHGQNNSNK